MVRIPVTKRLNIVRILYFQKIPTSFNSETTAASLTKSIHKRIAYAYRTWHIASSIISQPEQPMLYIAMLQASIPLCLLKKDIQDGESIIYS